MICTKPRRKVKSPPRAMSVSFWSNRQIHLKVLVAMHPAKMTKTMALTKIRNLAKSKRRMSAVRVMPFYPSHHLQKTSASKSPVDMDKKGRKNHLTRMRLYSLRLYSAKVVVCLLPM